jgi:hypothetical protein
VNITTILFSLYINSIRSFFTSPFLFNSDDLVLYDSRPDESAVIINSSVQIETLSDSCHLNGATVNFDITNFMVFHKERDRTLSSVTHEITV